MSAAVFALLKKRGVPATQARRALVPDVAQAPEPATTSKEETPPTKKEEAEGPTTGSNA